jgi:hypothetical protein
LSIGDCPCIELIAWLLAADSARRISLFSFYLSDMDRVKASAALIAAAAGSLEQLCIDCVAFPQVFHVGKTVVLSGRSPGCSPDVSDEVSETLSLARLDHLQSLTIQHLTIPTFE